MATIAAAMIMAGAVNPPFVFLLTTFTLVAEDLAVDDRCSCRWTGWGAF